MSVIPESPETFSMRGYKRATQDVPIPLEDLEKEYCSLINQPYPIPEMVFVRSWMLFRVCLSIFCSTPNPINSYYIKLSVIAQGIAARYARRQASSERAFLYVSGFPIIGKLAKLVLEDEGILLAHKSKL